MTALLQYFKASYEELELVRWPTRQQAVRLSAIVLTFTVVSAVVFGFIDFVLSSGVYLLLSNTLS